MAESRLPIGLQSFRSLREGNKAYVDKTHLIKALLDRGRFYFLARPRRFGKSLLISTLASLFRGERSLFNGLAIESNYLWEPHPVVHLSFDTLAVAELGLREALCVGLEEVADEAGIALSGTRSPKLYLRTLIRKLSKRSGKGVALLIDEYDRPIADAFRTPQEAISRREILRDVFSQLKTLEEDLRFVFLTGVTKFTKTSLFSELNNLIDLTFDPQATTLCGYTEEELVSQFGGELEECALRNDRAPEEFLAEVRGWYNGYRWTNGPSVYNPFSVLSLLSSGAFRNYWFDSGAPRIVLDLMAPPPREEHLEGAASTYSQLDTLEPGEHQPLPILFQTGYLTVRHEVGRGGVELTIPNIEVRTSLINHFLAHDSLRSDATTQTLGEQVMAALQSKDAEAFMRSLNPFLASIPVILFPRTPEALYQTILHTIVAASGLTSFCEQFAGDGRADCVVTTRDTIFLIEWKVDQPAETAIAQMKRQRYSEPYKHKGKKLICVGLSGRRDRREVYDVLFSDEDE